MAMLLSEFVAGRSMPPASRCSPPISTRGHRRRARGLLHRRVADVPEKRLERFFHRESNGYRIRRELREMMLFAHHNVIKDPPFSHLDLISCRNLLIYLNRTAQQRILETFHFALRPGGYLLLGPSESPDSAGDLFVAVDRNVHLYETRMVDHASGPARGAQGQLPRALLRATEPRPIERFAPLDVHHRLLEEYAPPSLIVTEDHTLVHMSSRAGRYLQMPAGEPSRDVLKLIRPELRVELRTALYQAAKNRSSVEVAQPADRDRRRRAPSQSHCPAGPPRGRPGPRLLPGVVRRPRRRRRADARMRHLDPTPEPIALQLEEELARVKAQLRTTVEQYESQVEEAQASAEEHQAMNEELRSSAEELETSKEEIQSVNEELTTVNQELKIKIEELRLSNNDFKNLINSTDIATLFLDRSLRLKLTTPRAQDIFNLLRTDIGRPLSDITSRLVDHRLEDDLRLALEHLRPIEREVRRPRPLVPHAHAALSNERRPDRGRRPDVPGHHRPASRRARGRDERGADAPADRRRHRLRHLHDYGGGHDRLVEHRAQRMFGYSSEEILGRRFDVFFTQEDRAAGVPAAELTRPAATAARSTSVIT